MPGPHGPKNVERSRDFAGTWKKLLRYSSRYGPALLIALLAALTGTVLTLLGPDKLSDLTNLIVEGMLTGIDMSGVARIGITLIVFYLASLLLSIAQNAIMVTVTQRIARQMR